MVKLGPQDNGGFRLGPGDRLPNLAHTPKFLIGSIVISLVAPK